MQLPAVRLPGARVMAAAGAGLLIGIIGVGAVTAAPQTPSAAGTAPVGQAAPSPSASPAAGTHPKARRALTTLMTRSGYRVEFNATNRAGNHDLLYVRGTITIGSGTITVTLPDNSTQAFSTTSDTVVRSKGNKVSLSSLKDGDHAMVFGTKNTDGTYTARLIRCLQPPATNSGGTVTPSASPAS